MKRLWKIILVATVAITAVSAPALASLAANYLVPSHVNITTTPGIQVIDQNGVVTFFEWGDLQTGTSNTKTIMVKNSQGNSNLWLLDGTVKTLTTGPAMPQGVTLSWDLASQYPVSNCPTAQSSGITGCLMLGPGQVSGTLTLTLAASTGAAPSSAGGFNFNTVFNAYSTATG